MKSLVPSSLLKKLWQEKFCFPFECSYSKLGNEEEAPFLQGSNGQVLQAAGE